MATDPDVPEFYVDQFTTTAAVYGVTITYGLSAPHPSPGQQVPRKDVVRLRMSLEHAKIMTMLIKRQLKRYEEEMGAQINIPMRAYTGLGISSEDW